ncbi:hypothetical protein DO71_3057 [Burkholderia pseudomallei]|nr:hypothetical protein DO71_3057 [Burkholderia pseudomallei]KGD15668.1 hypothetical protein DP42_3186 [Burkholderia pseudomallei]KGD49507.1 hypothetical protein DP43_3239 [Burkholderia pseudomallei]MBM5616695.1 hypothetical protein [Burkholderia pseudomallei]MBM5634665.1 hypothetical protein [Burkholderia pseudomallei]
MRTARHSISVARMPAAFAADRNGKNPHRPAPRACDMNAKAAALHIRRSRRSGNSFGPAFNGCALNIPCRTSARGPHRFSESRYPFPNRAINQEFSDSIPAEFIGHQKFNYPKPITNSTIN